MSHFRLSCLAVLIALLLSAAAVAQKTRTPAKPKAAPAAPAKLAIFTSTEGGFSIELGRPANTVKAAPIEGLHTGGKSYAWRIGGTVYSAGYAMRAEAEYPIDERSMVEGLGADTITKAEGSGGKLKYKNEINLGDVPGIEIAVTLKSGAIELTRYYATKDKIYLLSTGWPASANGEAQLKVLDTFEVKALPSSPAQ
jgi:hypothetical protein